MSGKPCLKLIVCDFVKNVSDKAVFAVPPLLHPPKSSRWRVFTKMQNISIILFFIPSNEHSPLEQRLPLQNSKDFHGLAG